MKNKKRLKIRGLDRRYSGAKREYYNQYLLDEILKEEDKRDTTNKLLKKIEKLAKKIVNEENYE